mmetsp:Transcript_25561/g.67478  ORF Transcript_25561/g.67478 Transcript_25561/m.67478 type:complete len:441 (+) Transcript_25561:1528-2850(+)
MDDEHRWVVEYATKLVRLSEEPAPAHAVWHALERRVVQVALDVRQPHRDHELQPPGQFRLQDVVALALHQLVKLLRERPHAPVHLRPALPRLLLCAVASEGASRVDALLVELLEALLVAEEAGLDVVDHVEVLEQVVLQRRAREQQPVAVLGLRNRLELADEAAVHVLEAVALVDDHELPRELPQLLDVADHDLVRRDHHRVALLGLRAVVPPAQLGALLLGAVVDDGLHRGRPLGKLALPIVQRRQRAHHQEGAGNVLLAQVCQHRDRLHGLPEAHLVAEDAVEAILVEADQPMHADQLVRPHVAARDESGLRERGALDRAIDARHGTLTLLLDLASQELGVRNALREQVLQPLHLGLLGRRLQLLPLLLFQLYVLLLALLGQLGFLLHHRLGDAIELRQLGLQLGAGAAASGAAGRLRADARLGRVHARTLGNLRRHP